MKILVFNCGSSSLKFELVELDSAGRNRESASRRGTIEEIGPRASAVMQGPNGASVEHSLSIRDHAAAAGHALRWLESVGGKLAPDAIAHRVVHGGEQIIAPDVINDAVMHGLEQASRFAPLHNPPALATIRAMQSSFPGLPQTVVADTAFHQRMPKYARSYAIPYEMAQRHGIRRFGFHGIGHAWMMNRYAEIRGAAIEGLRLITLHLGAGCSATAIDRGHSVDTSMGLTPLEGLMMGTRSGDLDPAIINYLAACESITTGEVEDLLNHKSGLLGVSGLSSDLRELEAAAGANDKAALAIEMFCYRVRKYVGAYIAALDGVDAVIFGGGIGEHSVQVRARVCSRMEKVGIVFDEQRNREANGRAAQISAEGSPVELHVIPLDEELYIARAAAALIAGRDGLRSSIE